jgi:hypothetical protein
MTDSLRSLVLEVVREVMAWEIPECSECKKLGTCDGEDFICIEGLEAGLKEINIKHRLTGEKP